MPLKSLEDEFVAQELPKLLGCLRAAWLATLTVFHGHVGKGPQQDEKLVKIKRHLTERNQCKATDWHL